MQTRRQTRATALLGWLMAGLLLLGGTQPAAAQQQQEIPLGSKMPMQGTTLQKAKGGQASLGSLTGSNGTVVVFWSNDCLWVDRYENRLMELASTFGSKGFNFALVNSNDATAFPKENAEASKQRAQSKGYTMPYLMDKKSELARAFGALRAPHVFVFDASNTLVYVGTIDDRPTDPGNVNKTYLKDALDALAQGNSAETSKTEAYGCQLDLQN